MVDAPSDSPKPADAAALKPRPPRAKTPADPKAAETEGGIARRSFIWWGTAGFVGMLVACFCRFFGPRSLFGPKTRLLIGFRSEYGFGVDTKWQAKQRIWVCRDSSGLYVILARCTHLGCTPDWKESENKFKCPCHGSGFDAAGVNFEGPAPKPMLRCHLELDPSGQVLVDKLRLYDYEDFKDAKPGTSGPLLAV